MTEVIIAFVIGCLSGLAVAFFVWKNNRKKIDDLTAKIEALRK